MGHPDTLITGIPIQRKGGGLGKFHRGFPSLNKNKNRQNGINHQQVQSCRTYNPPSVVLYHTNMPTSKGGGKWVTQHILS